MTVVDSDRTFEPAVDNSEVPLIMGIALDDAARRRLAALVDGTGVLIFSPDVETARAMLGATPAGERAGTANRWRDEPTIRIGDLVVDQLRCRVSWHGAALAVTKRERELLAFLADQPTRVRTHEELHAAAWDCLYLDPGPVHAAIKRLRRRLREAGVSVRIDAVRGVGYQLVEADTS